MLVAVLGGCTAVAAVITGVVVLRGGAERTPSVAPPEIALDITSTPPGARVRIDGNDRGATPLSLPLSGKPVIVVIDKPGYTPVTRKLAGDHPESLRVPLSPVTLFEGVWALPDGALRAFERRGEQVAMFKLASGTSEREFERFFEFVGSDPGLVAFTATETHVDPRAPDEPSCNVPLRAEYQYDVTTDALERRQERIALELEDGHCVPLAREWTPEVALHRLAAADRTTWAESSAGASNVDTVAVDEALVPQVPNPADGKAAQNKPVEKKRKATAAQKEAPQALLKSAPGNAAAEGSPVQKKQVSNVDKPRAQADEQLQQASAAD